VLDTARKFQELGFRIKATEGTGEYLRDQGVACERSFKIHEHQRPNIADEIKSKAIDLIINTPIGKASKTDDAYIRKAAIKYKIPYLTTPAAAYAAVLGIAAARAGKTGVKSLQTYHKDIR
jgi:carbamoyl-phosphate synthase large subunit